MAGGNQFVLTDNGSSFHHDSPVSWNGLVFDCGDPVPAVLTDGIEGALAVSQVITLTPCTQQLIRIHNAATFPPLRASPKGRKSNYVPKA